MHMHTLSHFELSMSPLTRGLNNHQQEIPAGVMTSTLDVVNPSPLEFSRMQALQVLSVSSGLGLN